jgi:hypothetical protein
VVDATTYARMNKWAAFTLLAKVYQNAEVYTGTAHWQECISACDSVLNSGNYELEANFKDVFKVKNETQRNSSLRYLLIPVLMVRMVGFI